MDRAEIERHLHAGRGHSVVVDAREVDEAPGNVRLVTIHRGNRVSIEYDQARAYVEGDFEGGGLKYVAQYGSLDELLSDLEDFLGAKVEAWTNYTAAPLVPKTLDDPDGLASRAMFEDLVRRSAVPLPPRGKYELAGIHWRHVARYGEYRPDKAFEEQEERLGGYDDDE
jgi:hypothetical protein